MSDATVLISSMFVYSHEYIHTQKNHFSLSLPYSASRANDNNCATEKYWRHVFCLAFGCTKFEYIFLEKFWICCCGLRHRIAGWIGGSQDCTGLVRLGAHRGWKWLTHSGHISTPLPFISLDFLPFKYVVFYFRGSNPWLTPVYQIHIRWEWSSSAFDSSHTVQLRILGEYVVSYSITALTS